MSPQAERSTPEVARNEAAGVARTAADRGSDVAGTVSEQANKVASETGRQARNLFHEGKDQLGGQAAQGQQRAADGLHRIADQLHQMAERSDGEGVVPEMARQAADKTHGLASWLQKRDPGTVVDEVRRFARRKPAVFLVGAAIAGVAVGRLTRGAVAAQSSDSPGGSGARSADGNGGWRSSPAAAPTPPPSATYPATYPEQQTYPPSPPMPTPGVSAAPQDPQSRWNR